MVELLVNTTNIFDKNAFEQLFKQHFSSLVYFARKYVKDLDSSKEIVHDVYVNLWEKRDTINPEKALKSYLFTAVHNRCLNFIRDNKKFNRNIEDLGTIEINYSQASDDNLTSEELSDKINKTIENLPEKCREVFMLSRFGDLKYNEIADQLGISVKTVEAQMSKALKVLRDQLKEYITILILLLVQIFK